MTFTPIPNGVRVVHQATVGPVTFVNTFGVQNGGGGSIGGDLSEIAKSHGDAWRANIVPLLSNLYRHTATLAYSLEDQSAAVGDAGYTAVAQGGKAGAPAPLSAAVVISLKTAKRGRTYQGRSYIGPLEASSLYTSGQGWSQAVLTAFTTAFGAYKDAVDPATGDNGRLAICSKGSPGHGISPHVEPVASFIVRDLIGTQRRRLT